MLPTFIIEKLSGWNTHSRDKIQVCEWRFVTHVPCTVEKICCLYVGALLGVWGIIPFFVCLTISLVDTFGVGRVWLGCCVRTV